MNKKILLAVVGHPSVGKDKFAELLCERHRFTFVSTGDEIRWWARERGLGALDRLGLNTFSTQLRHEFGPSFPVPNILAKYSHHPRLVLAGPRLVAEVEPIVELGGKVIAVHCPIQVRYERAKKRGRIGDNITFADFEAIEFKESRGSDPHTHNVQALLDIAHINVENNSTLDVLQQRVDEVVRQLV